MSTTTAHRARRRALTAAALAPAALAAAVRPRAARAADIHGRVQPPLPLPEVDVRRDDGRRLALADMLRGQVSALQFMFTGCRSTCPIQGVIFAQAQALLAQRGLTGVRLVSLSIDALGDDPPALARWLHGFSAGPQWRAAVPSIAHAARVPQWADVRLTAADTHSTAVLVFDAQARLVWRTLDMPDPASVVAVLAEFERRRAAG